MQNTVVNLSRRTAAKLTAVFLVLSILWIILSDRIIYNIFHNAEMLTYVQTIKGWFYVLSVGTLFFIFSYRALNRQHELFVKEIKSRDEGEKKLIRERKLFHTILNRIPVMICHYSSPKEILFLNRKMEQLTGWSTEEASGVDLLKEVFPDPQYRKEAVAYMEKAGNQWREFTVISRSGEQIDSEWSNIKLDDDSQVGIGLDIRQHKKTMEELKRSQQELRSLALHMNNILEEERLMLSREIHDELGQTLTVLKIKLALLSEDVIDTLKQQETEKIENEFENIDSLIDKAVKNINAILSRLRPETLESIGLVASIESMVSEFEKNTGIAVTVHIIPENFSMGRNNDLMVFRIIQEALTNVARHANATQVQLKIERQGVPVSINISDNGKGFDNTRSSKKINYGLIGMRERALAIGGSLKINTGGSGTEICVKINKVKFE